METPHRASKIIIQSLKQQVPLQPLITNRPAACFKSHQTLLPQGFVAFGGQ